MSDTCPDCGCKHGCLCEDDKPVVKPPSSLAPATGSESKALKLWSALKSIASYDPPEIVRRDAEHMGLEENEAVEMAYENVLSEAKEAIRRTRRPRN